MTNVKKILIVVCPEGFRDEEYLEPRSVLEQDGHKVSVASLKLGQAKGVNGALASVDFVVGEVKVEDFEAVIFVGGGGMVPLVSDERLTVLAQKFYQAGKITAAICIAPVILANAGLLFNKRATVWQGAKDELIKAGAIYTGKDVEIDGAIVTADGPGSAKKFGETILGLLC